MTDLDTLARAATQDLLERTTPDVRSRYADLRRTRARRTTAKLAAAGAAIALAVGGWQLAGPQDDTIEPAPQPGLRNGVLLGLPTDAVAPGAAWSTLLGSPLTNLPQDSAVFAQYQFTAAGNEIVYADRDGRLSAVGVSTGLRRTLAECPDRICAGSLSPDGGTIAFSNRDRLLLQTVGSGAVRTVPAQALDLVGAPAWSPDGRSLAVAGGDGLYVVNVTDGDVRQVTGSTAAGPVSWSPDGRSVAYFVTEEHFGQSYDQQEFTAVSMVLETGVISTLLDAGRCACVGLAAPALAWSPDGLAVAVAITKDAGLPWGVYLVHQDGSAPELVASGSYAALAWQPLRG